MESPTCCPLLLLFLGWQKAGSPGGCTTLSSPGRTESSVGGPEVVGGWWVPRPRAGPVLCTLAASLPYYCRWHLEELGEPEGHYRRPKQRGAHTHPHTDIDTQHTTFSAHTCTHAPRTHTYTHNTHTHHIHAPVHKPYAFRCYDAFPAFCSICRCWRP